MLARLRERELVYSILMKFTQVAGGLLIVKILTTVLSREDYGLYSVVLSIVALLGVIPFAGLNNGVFRFSSDSNPKVFFSNCLVLYVCSLIVHCGLLVVVLFLVSPDSTWFRVATLTPTLLISTTLLGSLTWFENGLNRQDHMTLVLGSDFLLKAIAVLLLTYLDCLSVESIIAAFSLVSFLVFVLFVFKFGRLVVVEISYSAVKEVVLSLFDYIYPIVIWGFFVWAQGMVCRVYLALYAGSDEVASFSVLSSLAIIPVTTITGVLASYVLPKLFNSGGRDEDVYRYIFRVMFFSCSFLCFILIFLLFFSSEVVLILTSDKYVEDAWMLPYMFAAMIVFAVGNILSYTILAKKNTVRLIFSNVIPGLSAIVLGYFLVGHHGLMGALITFIVTYVIAGLLNGYVVIKNMRKSSG